MERYGFSLDSSYALPTAQVLDLLAEAGFSAVSPGWRQNEDLSTTILSARQRSLALQSLHGPLRGMRAMWSREWDLFQPILRDILASAEDCARFEIPILVIHPWNGLEYTFRADHLCFDHFDALVTRAEQLGITVAFENLEGAEYLRALMDRYTGSNAVGFCWDSGHERCYAKDQDFLGHFGDKLVMTHLNDNLGITDPEGRMQGTDDLHLLPGDGILNWQDTVRRLKNARHQEILNFELKIRPKGDRCRLDLYSGLPLAQYIRQAFQQGRDAVGSYFG